MSPPEYVDKGALISSCGKYRYRLWREWRLGNSTQWEMWTEDDGDPVLDGEGKQLGEPRSCVFVMLNPSTADGEQDDPTIRRCVGFARQLGFDRLEVVNLFAYRASEPASLYALSHDDDPCGPDNERQVADALDEAGLIVCAWGAHGGHLGQDETMLGWLESHNLRNARVVALALTKGGFPRHPLYLPANVQPTPYRGRAYA